MNSSSNRSFKMLNKHVKFENLQKSSHLRDGIFKLLKNFSLQFLKCFHESKKIRERNCFEKIKNFSLIRVLGIKILENV